MFYQRSLEIEKRLEKVLRLIRTGRYSTPQIAKKVGVSIPTVSRCVNALRERGYRIQAERTVGGWRYLLDEGKVNLEAMDKATLARVHGE